jgi:hypothetical protein
MAKEKKKPEKDGETSEIVRKFKSNPAVFIGTVVILVLVIVSFVLVPAIVPEASRSSGTDLTFGYYEKVPISYVQGNFFAQYFQMMAQYYQSMNPENFRIEDMNLWRSSFEAAAIHTAILQEVKKSGYEPPAQAVDRKVAELPQFQENGRFSPALYQRASATTQQTLWRQVHDDMIKEMYFNDITGLLVSEAEGEFMGRMAADQRSFGMVSFSVDDYPESEFLAYARANPDHFRLIHLSKIAISSSEREAMQIYNSIKDGTTTFEDAARSYSTDSYADRGGDMGMRIAYDLASEITDPGELEKVMSLGRGELSGLLQSGNFWNIYRAEEPAQPADFTDELNMERLRTYMRNNERGKMEDWAVGEAARFIRDINANGLEAALGEWSKEEQFFGPVPLNFGSVDLFSSISQYNIQELSYAGSNENFWRALFSIAPGAISEPLVQGSSVLVFINTEVTEADASSIQSITSTYMSYWANYTTEQAIQPFFLNSGKMDNRFFETYFRTFMPTGF